VQNRLLNELLKWRKDPQDPLLDLAVLRAMVLSPVHARARVEKRTAGKGAAKSKQKPDASKN
jgi:hypothetical protein